MIKILYNKNSMNPFKKNCCSFIILIFMCIVLFWYFTEKDNNTPMSKLKTVSSIQQTPISPHEPIDIRIYETYGIIESQNKFDPSTILYVFQEYPNITHVIWFKPHSLKESPLDIIHYVGDSSISLVYETDCNSFNQDFIITQRSKFTMRLLSLLAKSPSSEFLDHLKNHIIERLNEDTTTFIRTYFTFIFIDTIQRDQKKFYIQNRLINPNVENKNICQTWVSHETNVEFLFQSSESIKFHYPEYNYYLFDDFEMKKFISVFYSQDVVERYDSILPTAFKSDFFRYLYLYKFGGFYFDITLISEQPLTNHINISDYDFICPYDLNADDTRQLYQAFMYARKYHPYLKKCIKTIMEYDISKHTSYSCLSVTGPKLIGDIVYKDYETKSTNLFPRHVDGNKIILENQTILYTRGNFKNIPVGKLMYTESQKNHYSKHCVLQTFFYN